MNTQNARMKNNHATEAQNQPGLTHATSSPPRSSRSRRPTRAAANARRAPNHRSAKP
jgi:hypothetical protein